MSLSRATNSLRIYAFFLWAFGAVFMFAPNFFLEAIRLEPTNDHWIRMMGVLTVSVGFFYFLAAQNQLKPFYRWSVGIRLFNAAAVIALVATRMAPPALLAFGAFDVVFALWTWVDVRADNPRTAADKQDPVLFKGGLKPGSSLR